MPEPSRPWPGLEFLRQNKNNQMFQWSYIYTLKKHDKMNQNNRIQASRCEVLTKLGEE